MTPTEINNVTNMQAEELSLTGLLDKVHTIEQAAAAAEMRKEMEYIIGELQRADNFYSEVYGKSSALNVFERLLQKLPQFKSLSSNAGKSLLTELDAITKARDYWITIAGALQDERNELKVKLLRLKGKD